MAKKLSIENPVMSYITTQEQTEETPTRAETPSENPEKGKAKAVRKEAKSRRLQLLIKPSTYERIKAKADADGTSVNDVINSLLEDAVGER